MAKNMRKGNIASAYSLPIVGLWAPSRSDSTLPATPVQLRLLRLPKHHPSLRCRGGCSIINEPPRGVFYYKNMNRFINYIKDTRGELQHVSWPTRRQAVMFTVVVIIISVVTSVFLGFFDYIFSLILQKFVL
jgi:preprotein translocase subunit SecE